MRLSGWGEGRRDRLTSGTRPEVFRYSFPMPSSQPCPFCTLPADRVLLASPLALVLRDAYPISPGHTLIIPRRHIASFFELTPDERAEVLALLDQARAGLHTEFRPDAYNIGINDGPAAGQTIGHLHIHLIPRYAGDQPDPRGGVRWIFPDKADYWTARADPARR